MKTFLLLTLGVVSSSAFSIIKSNHYVQHDTNSIERDGYRGDHADINNDGIEDMVLFAYNGISIYMGDGLGNFTKDFISTGKRYLDISIDDFNADGYLDFIAVGRFLGAEVWLNDQTGGFMKAEQDLGFIEYRYVSTGDLDLDGHVDVVLQQGYRQPGTDPRFDIFASLTNIDVFLNTGDQSFMFAENRIGDYYRSELIDMDGDGSVELLTSEITFSLSTVFTIWDFVEDTFVLEKSGFYPIDPPYLPSILNTIDWNGDGLQDILTSQFGIQQDEMVVLVQNDTSILEQLNAAMPLMAVLRSEDMNNDGLNDLLGRSRDGLKLLMNQGDGVFETTYTYPIPYFPIEIYTFDFDGDGDKDVFATDDDTGLLTFMNTHIDNDYSGLWYNPDQQGHGIQIEKIRAAGKNQLFVSWYVFDNGNPIWLNGLGEVNDGVADIDMITTSGGQFVLGQSTDMVMRQDWGTLRFEFSGSDQVNLTWDGSISGFSSGSMAMQKLSSISEISTDDSTISSCNSGTWYNLDEDGHGFMVTVSGPLPEPQLVITWFTYFNGSQYWMLAQGPIRDKVADMVVTIVTGGAFPPAFDFNDVSLDIWGSAVFELVGNDQANFRWFPGAAFGGFASQSLELVRLTELDRYRCTNEVQ